MENKKKKSVNEIIKVEEPSTVYQIAKKQGIDENFDFEKEFKNGLTIEEVKDEMRKRIAKWDWKK